MNKLTSFSIKHPVSILMYTLLLILLGLLSLFTIKMDYLPYISDRTILISTVYEGLPASQMKELITIPEEDFLSSIKGIKNISSVTRDSLSFIKIEFQYQTEINSALLEVRQSIDQFYQRLPEKASKPKAEIFSTEKNYLLTIAVIPPKSELANSRYLIEKQIKHDLQKINGCGKIEITGGLEKQITFETDLKLLNSRNITIEKIAESIENTNYEYPAGTIRDSENEYILKTSNLFTEPEEILQTQIITGNDILTLKDLGTVKNDYKQKESFCLLNNMECIEIEISKKSDASPVTLSSDIKKYITNIKNKYPDYHFIITDDTSIEIKNNIILVYLSAISGTIICFLLITFFFKNMIIALIISSVIPLCILFSISILKITGKNINLFSLSGIAISLGMIIDPASIFIQKLIQSYNLTRKTSFDNLLLSSSQKIQKSNLGSSITTIIVFFPLFLLPGILGELFCDLSISIISSIIFSYTLSITYIPAISKLFLSNQLYKIKQSKFLNKINIYYKDFITRNINNPKIIKLLFTISFSVLFLSCFLIKKEITPKNYSPEIIFSIEYPENNSINYIQSETESLVSELLKDFPNANIYTKAGIDSKNFYKLSDYLNTTNDVFYTISKISKKQKNEIIKKLESSDLPISIQNKRDIVSKALNIKHSYLIQNFSNIQSNLYNFKPDYKTNETTFTPDTEKCNYYHIPQNYISYYCYQILNGLEAGEILANGIYIPIKVKTQNIDASNINIQYNNSTVPLSFLGNFSINQTEKILFRYNKKDSKEIDYRPDNIPDENICKLNQQQFSELISNGSLLLIIVLILLYSFLGSQFESFTLPFILLIAVIPASTGALFFLFIFKQTLNIYSILSLIILFGTCVNTSIIFYEAVSISSGKISITELCSQELNSILITTITSIAALIPFTFDPFNINSQISISIALCGGLSFSMLFSIILYPHIFTKIRINRK